MGTWLLLLVLLAVVMAAGWSVDGGRRVLFPLILLYAALAFGVLLSFVDAAAPFASGGDDRSYYFASQVRLRGPAAWVDFNQFHSFAQGGYPLMLAWVYQVTGASPFVYKAVNLFLYLLLAVLWFRIGSEMGGRKTAYAFAVAILLGTPLWMYWMFILKDMAIVLVQSLFLLGAVRLARGRGGVRTWVPIVAGTVLLVPFRIYLVLLHAAVTLATAVLAGRQSPRRKAALLVASAALVGGLVALGGNERVIAAFGAGGGTRTLDYETVRGVSEQYAQKRSKYSGPVGMVVFPLAYVFGETSGLRLGSGSAGTTGMAARPDVVAGGLGAVPWIFIGSPLFAYALLHMVRRRVRPPRRFAVGPPRGRAPPAPRPVLAAAGPPGRMAVHEARSAAAPPPVLAPYSVHRSRHARAAAPSAEDPGAVARGWLPLLLFLGLYAVVAWVVEDTTRWRMPAFPVMTALAAQGWIWLGGRGRALVVGGWATGLAVLLTLYYAVLK